MGSLVRDHAGKDDGFVAWKIGCQNDALWGSPDPMHELLFLHT